MNLINWDKLLESLKKPLLKLIKDTIEEAKQSDDFFYVKKAKACDILDCDGKTFNEHFANRLDVYYLGDSTIKRYLRKDVEKLGKKAAA